MQWHSLSEFLAMGGYAGYVWGSVVCAALVVTIEPWLLGRQHHQIVATLRRRVRAEHASPTSIPRPTK